MLRNASRLENAIGRLRGYSFEREVFPDPDKVKKRKRYVKDFQRNSTFVITTHFLKSLMSPTILAMPAGFKNGGLFFSIFGFLFILTVVGYNSKRLIDSAAYLSRREQTTLRTYDEVAYVSFNTCTERTKKFATFFRILINVLFVITYLDACCIFMIFMARNVEALINFHFPGSPFNVYHYLFLQVMWMMLMSSIRDLKYLTPFSFVSCLMLIVVIVLTTSFFFLRNVPKVEDRVWIGTLRTIPRFASVVSFSLSGISIALTLKSSMIHPEHFFGFPGTFFIGLIVMSVTFIPFGFLGYLQYGSATSPSILLNLPLDDTLAVCVKVTGIFSIFFTSPLVFYVAFNVLWNNYLKKFVNPINLLSAEYLGRYCFIVLSFLLALCLPNLGTMIAFKGAFLHSHLEITIPAILDYATYYPTEGHGKFYGRLIRAVLIILFGFVLCVSGATAAIMDLIDERNHTGQYNNTLTDLRTIPKK